MAGASKQHRQKMKVKKKMRRKERNNSGEFGGAIALARYGTKLAAELAPEQTKGDKRRQLEMHGVGVQR